MRIAELVAALLLAALSVYMMWKSGTPSWEGDPWGQNIWYDDEGIGSGFWPFWLSLIMLISCVWIVVNWVRRASPPARSGEPFLDGWGIGTLVKVGGGLLAFVALIDVIGMYAAMALFLFYYLFALGRHRVGTSLAVALGAPVFCFFFFDVAMRIPLPKGYSEPLFLPLYDIFL